MVPCSSVSSRTMSVAEIGFAQPSRFGRVVRELRSAEHVGADPARELLHARGLLLIGAQLLVEQHRPEPLDVVGERLLAIRVEEEPRIAQPRGQHALHVSRDHVRLLGLHVEHGEKHRHQLALVAHDRKEMLMVNHRRRQHFFGQLEKFLREPARNHHRIFDQIRNLIQHALPDQRARDAPAAAARFALELAARCDRGARRDRGPRSARRAACDSRRSS